ncbi:MAG: DUF1906 domain-containing protein [Candidatus Nomurabacteria bacterium]|jgi:hypothetical protein|nr:DUF1906 domain-containing protein [Candidatus Nomurabacteria bacterium]
MENNKIKRPENMEELKERAFRIPLTTGIEMFWPQSGEDKQWLPQYAEKIVYGVNNSVVAWVSDAVYVFPYFRGITEILRKQGYKDRRIFIPFSNWDRPANAELCRQWERLCGYVISINWEDARSDARATSEAGDIPDEILVGMKEIPVGGIEYRFQPTGDVDTVYPLMTSPCVDGTVSPKLGVFNTNNGGIVVNSNDGRTYFGRTDCNIIQVLQSLGYKQAYVFVPFSNGEEMVK